MLYILPPMMLMNSPDWRRQLYSILILITFLERHYDAKIKQQQNNHIFVLRQPCLVITCSNANDKKIVIC